MDIKTTSAFMSLGILICLISLSALKGNGDSESTNKDDGNSELVDIQNNNENSSASILINEAVDIELNEEEANQEDDITYELLNGNKVELSKNPQRVEYISDEKMNDYLETAISYIYTIFNFDKYDESTIFNDSLKYLQGDLRNSVEGLIGRATKEFNLKYQAEEHSHNVFPYEVYSKENKDVLARKITNIKVTENETFAYPFLQLHLNINSIVTLENGSTNNRNNLFIVEFAVGQPNKVIVTYIGQQPSTTTESE